MLVKTKAIVLHTLKYSDNSVIVHFYTEEHGRIACMVSGVYSKKGKFKNSYFQPLNQLVIDYYFKLNRGLQNLKEVSGIQFLNHDQYYIERSSMAIFIAEVLYKLMREEEANQTLFQFLSSAIEILNISNDIKNMHLLFLMHLTRYAGIMPENNFSENCPYFNIPEGKFNANDKKIGNVGIYESKCINQLFNYTFSTVHELKISGRTRNNLLAYLLRYYKQHIDVMEDIKSLDILHEVFSS